MGLKHKLGPLLYGAVFCVGAPAFLIWWTRAVPLPIRALHAPLAGGTIALLGMILMAGGMLDLWRRGGGLPMNAFPPPRLVTRGFYGVFPHPIYLGFVLACAGTALYAGSASGLFLTTPLVALACLALVVGYERPFMLARHSALPRPLLAGVVAPEAPLTFARRFGAAIAILIPWLLAFYGVKALGMPPRIYFVDLPGETRWPVWPWTHLVYATAYVGVPLAFFLVPTGANLRRLMIRGWIAMLVTSLAQLCLPLLATGREHSTASLFGRSLQLEKSLDMPMAAFPSYHVVWVGLAAWAIALRGGGWRVAAWLWAAGVSISCVTTAMHGSADIIAAWGVLAFALNLERAWAWMLRLTERLANSWKAWRFGPVRVINHGLWGGLAAGAGCGVAILLAGPQVWPAIAIMLLCGVAGAGLWAQIIEGSSVLLRPFGYYGGVLGLITGACVARAFGYPLLLPLAAFACAGPWVQAFGRVRCIIQGCCHGRPVCAQHGIRVINTHSRVCALAELRDTPIHATQLYSILGNIIIGTLLARLWFLGSSLSFIGGMYLVLAGAARFMEEAWRGEPQTRRSFGLPIYQWLSIVSFFAGMLVCALPSEPSPSPSLAALAPAILVGLFGLALGWFALGIDFPESNRRFSRLSG